MISCFARLGPRASDRDPRLIVAVGRLVEKKGFGDLVEACRILSGRDRELRLAIVGDGELRAKLERQIADSGLGSRAHLLGARPAGETLELIASAAVLVLPCVVAEDGDRDGLPTVILEAMALATPVVSTDLPGVPEMIEDGVSGRIVAQHDPAALADVLDELLVSPVRRAGMAQEALAVARRRFDLATNVGELVTLFRSSIGDGP